MHVNSCTLTRPAIKHSLWAPEIKQCQHTALHYFVFVFLSTGALPHSETIVLFPIPRVTVQSLHHFPVFILPQPVFLLVLQHSSVLILSKVTISKVTNTKKTKGVSIDEAVRSELLLILFHY